MAKRLTSAQRLEPNLRGQGSRAEADAARRLHVRAAKAAREDVGRRAAPHSCMLTRQLGCRASARPRQVLARVSRPTTTLAESYPN